jgi:hypothetical protein
MLCYIFIVHTLLVIATNMYIKIHIVFKHCWTYRVFKLYRNFRSKFICTYILPKSVGHTFQIAILVNTIRKRANYGNIEPFTAHLLSHSLYSITVVVYANRGFRFKRSIFWDIMPCNPAKANQIFGGREQETSMKRTASNWNVGLLSSNQKVLYHRRQNS